MSKSRQYADHTYHRREELEKRGYKLIGLAKTMPGYGLIRRMLITHDLAWGSVTAFRIEDDHWEIYTIPDAKSGFKDEPLLV